MTVRPATDLFVLGSGFSRALSSRMPTTRELAAPLTTFLSLTDPGVPAESLLGRDGDDVEALLGYLADPQPWQSDAVLHRSLGALSDCVSYIAQHLWMSQQDAMSEELPETLDSLIRRWHEDRTTIVTFNYDTLIEAAFNDLAESLSLPKSGAAHLALSTLWLPQLGNRQGRTYWGGDFPDTFRLLKLHGSLNWLYSGERGAYGDVIYDTGKVGQWDTDDRTKFASILEQAPGLEPAVLPPTPNKVGMMANGMFRALWERAAAAVTDAGRIIVVGYSVPSSDRIVRTMMAVTAAPIDDEDNKTVIPVNTDSKIADVCSAVFPSANLVTDFCGVPDALNIFVDAYCDRASFDSAFPA